MCELLASGLILCSGVLGYAGPLDAVAERRWAVEWGGLESDPAGYEVLLGLRDCDLVGKDGWLVAGDKIYTALVADCNQAGHYWPSPYYLGDVSRKLASRKGWLILK